MLAEEDYLDKTLDSLRANDEQLLDECMVICVVNNQAPEHCPQDLIAENQRTLATLETMRGENGPLHIAYIDASSPGNELPPKQGVGLARKLGMDWALDVFSKNEAHPGILVCLDADTLVQPDYLSALSTYFENPDAWAAVLSYAHPIDAGTDERRAIIAYELFLRYHELGLASARSPYAYHSIGSTIACTADAYAAVSGMNRRQGGEDFYFLQELAKTGGVGRITSTCVHPSPRPSQRVPFGTGPRVQQFLDQPDDAYLVYDVRCYDVLREWLEVVAHRDNDDCATLLAQAQDIAPDLAEFLKQQHFERSWERLCENTRDTQSLTQEFHRWFDAFRTLKLIHYLRAHSYPERDIFECISTILDQMDLRSDGLSTNGLRADYDAQANLLHHLRACCNSRDEGISL